MKLLLPLMCLLSVTTVKAQNWGGGIDDNNLHFGFTFQYVSSEYKILKKPDWRTFEVEGENGIDSSYPKGFSSISSKPSSGFGIGFVVNQKVHDNVDLRLTPILVFNDRILNYRFEEVSSGSAVPDPIDVRKKLETTVVEFPLSLKIKSNRRNNFRAYMMGGLKYTMDISSKKKTNNEPLAEIDKFVNNRRNFLSYEAGLGMDLYFEYFKMSPEIKLSYSFDSVKKNEAPHVFSTPIDKLMLRHVTFSLFFE